MFLRTSSGVLRHDRLHIRLPLQWIALILAAIGGLIVFYVFAVPQLLRFRFRADLSWYDLGAQGFGPDRSYISFDQESPIVEITPHDAKCDPRYTFLAPRGDSIAHPGPMILNPAGELVWTKWNGGTTQDFKMQRYKGEDYLTYWQGDTADGYGRGSWYMVWLYIELAYHDYRSLITLSIHSSIRPIHRSMWCLQSAYTMAISMTSKSLPTILQF